MAVLELRYFSNALGKAQRAVVLVPESAGPYHVLFQLHGLSDDESAWTRYTSIERYVQGLPLLVVMPDGGRGFYCDAREGFAYGTAIGKELPELVERWFPTKPGWAIGGLSMGGYGCARLALTYPERFVSSASHSGAMTFGHYTPDASNDFGKEFLRVLGPDPVDGPDDLFALAKKASPKPKLRVDCGVDDFLIEANRSFHELLDELGYAHEYEEFPGEHNWAYWDEHFPKALAFHRASLGF